MATIIVDSNLVSDINAAINSAANGDSVLMLPGNVEVTATSITVTGGKYVTLSSTQPRSATFVDESEPLTINAAGGTIVLQGGAAPAFDIDKTSAGRTRITGLRFHADGGNGAYITWQGSGKSVRIDNNEMESLGAIPNIIDGNSRGLIFHNNTISGPANGHLDGCIQLEYGSDGDAEWASASTFGDDDITGETNSYFEKNEFYRIQQQSVDCDNGARIVFRYNYMEDAALVIHGADTSQFGGGRQFEVYHNHFKRVSNAFAINRWAYIRGGTGVIFNNYFDRADSPDGTSFPNKFEIDLTLQTIRRNDGLFGCWSGGYPCPYQPGQIVSGIGGVGMENPPSKRICVWGNTGPGAAHIDFIKVTDFSPNECGGGAPSAATFIVEDRDFSRADANITWASGYAPFTFPHPATQDESMADSLILNQTANSAPVTELWRRAAVTGGVAEALADVILQHSGDYPSQPGNDYVYAKHGPPQKHVYVFEGTLTLAQAQAARDDL